MAQGPALRRAWTPPQVVVTLPTNPQDGQEVDFLANPNSPSDQWVFWRFRYYSAGGVYKWQFVGGPPLYSYVAIDNAMSSSSYAALSTAGPMITCPLAGIFMVRHGCVIMVNGNALTHALMSYDVGGVPAGDAWAISYVETVSLNRSACAHLYRHGFATPLDVTAKYRVSTANGATFSQRWLEVSPVKVA